MNAQELLDRCSAAAEEFDRHEQRSDGVQIIESLCGGLTLLRDTLFARVHREVESHVGFDSLIAPVSEEKTERTAKLEIEIYQVVVSAGTAEAAGYVADAAWYRDWLARLRFGQFDAAGHAARRINYYAARTPQDQRLGFGNVLATALPESARAPLILLKLVPPAVKIATALAFANTADALRFRREQAEILPPIGECHQCGGKLLENGEQCIMCGNPLWNFEWLTSA